MSGDLRFLTDEDFDNRILRGLKRFVPDVDICRVQDVGLLTAADTVILAWANDHNRILLTHDVATMPVHARERLRRGERIAGVYVIPQGFPIGAAIADLTLIAELGRPEEWEWQVRYITG